MRRKVKFRKKKDRSFLLWYHPSPRSWLLFFDPIIVGSKKRSQVLGVFFFDLIIIGSKKKKPTTRWRMKLRWKASVSFSRNFTLFLVRNSRKYYPPVKTHMKLSVGKNVTLNFSSNDVFYEKWYRIKFRATRESTYQHNTNTFFVRKFIAFDLLINTISPQGGGGWGIWPPSQIQSTSCGCLRDIMKKLPQTTFCRDFAEILRTFDKFYGLWKCRNFFRKHAQLNPN